MSDRTIGRGGLTRRRFVVGATALAAGGAALNALAKRALAQPAVDDVALAAQPRHLPKRQFAWAEYLGKDRYGNPQAPKYDRLLFFDVRGTPTLAHARLLESRLRMLERHFPWSHEGLLFTVSWGPSYFRALGIHSPIERPGRLSSFEHPSIDRYDMCLHLASDDRQRLAAIEAALRHGHRLAGVRGSLRVRSALIWRETRTGFTGVGIPAAHQRVKGIPNGDPVPTAAPLYMGFHSGMRKNQALEDDVAIRPHDLGGRFVDGTVMHVSYMRESLSNWYGKLDESRRIALMYSPQTNADNLALILEDRNDTSADTRQIDQAILRYGMIGHSQATAQARRRGRPLIIRRDFNTDDGGYAGLHFVAVQRSYQNFVVTRNAMNAAGAHNANRKITATRNNGINAFIDVRRRANYIMPSRAERSFPLLPGRASALA